MNIMRRFMVYLGFIVGVFFSGGISTVMAASSLGVFCWDVGDGAFVEVQVTDMGNQSFLMNGLATSPFGDPEPVSGEAEVEGGTIHTTLTGSGFDGINAYVYTVYSTLDAGTLSGTAVFHGQTGEAFDPNPFNSFNFILTEPVTFNPTCTPPVL